MIYDNYILQTYDINLADNIDIVGDNPYYAFLMRDGSIDYHYNENAFYTTINASFETLTNYLNGYYYADYLDNSDLLAVFVANPYYNDYAIINTSKIDFNMYSPLNNSNGYVYFGSAYRDYTIFDGESVLYNYSGLMYNTTRTGHQFNYSYNTDYNYVVLDYYNIVSPREEEYYTAWTNNQWNIFHYTSTFIKHQNGVGFTLSLGSTYEKVREDGYNNGYANGYTNGYQDGYNTGSTGISKEVNTAFDYIGAGFNAVAGIMSLEVLPHITLGLAFSIPLTLILIMTIFKLVRK